MRVEKNKVISIDYSVADEAGNVLDSSDDGEPLVYLHGVGAIISGLETALEGKGTGDKVATTIPPEDAYGEHDESLVYVVPRDEFQEIENLSVGMEVEAETETGVELLTVMDIDEEAVTLDGNHALAGMTLSFNVEVLDVREATAEELAHGHAHGPHGHEDDEEDDEFDDDFEEGDDEDDDLADELDEEDEGDEKEDTAK